MMSDIVFTCLHCGQSLAVEDSAVGMQIECPQCLKQLVVPKSSTEYPPAALAEPSERPPLSRERKTMTSDDSDSGGRDRPAESPVAPKPGGRIVADKRFFTLVRWIFVGISLGMIFFVVVAGIHLQKIRHLLAHQVAYQEIQKALQPAAATAQSRSPKSVPEIKFSDNIKKYYPGRNARELLEWLEKIDPDKRADFVANLSAVIKDAETQKAPDMRAVIVEYQRQKRLAPDFRATDAYSARPTMLALISFAVFLIGMLLAFFCLLLILLAVEKRMLCRREPME